MSIRLPQVNQVIIAGRIVKDAETKTVTSGKTVTEFIIAVDDGFGDKKVTAFHYVQLWNAKETLLPDLVKGRPVMVEGKLTQEQWEKDGKKYSRTRITAFKVHVLEWAADATKPESQATEEDIPF